MDFPVPFARSRSDSELVCFMVEAQHPATAAGTSLGQEREGRFKNQTLSNYRGPKNRPQTSKLKDKYSACCSLEVSVFFPEICLLVSLVTPLDRSKRT